MNWTTTQILSFAPDPNTAKRGESLATVKKWSLLAGNERAIWGACKGSGAKDYQTSVDLKGPAFKCSCPSRKFPCKHGLGLLLLYNNDPSVLTLAQNLPAWVADWLTTRDKKAVTSESKEQSPEAKAKSEALKAKNWQMRLGLMEKGIVDLDSWLLDLIRQGLAQTEGQDYAFWNGMATRMVDAKLAGVAKRIKALQLIQGATSDWPAKMLTELAEIYLISTGFKQRESLSAGLREALFSVAGVNVKKETLLDLPAVQDDWAVVGQITGIEENLNFRRTWLKGQQTQRYVLLLDFSFGNASYPQQWPVGSIFSGEMVYYPGSFPLRALAKEMELKDTPLNDFAGEKNIPAFMDAYADAVGLDPWITNFPCGLAEVVPAMRGDDLYLVDTTQRSIAVNKNDSAWKLMAISGGHPVSVFGEWSGERLIPLSATIGMRFVDLNE
ncbi:MAG: SWIM zinc finger domain-containing protein [Saprospiraceae bacterium]